MGAKKANKSDLLAGKRYQLCKRSRGLPLPSTEYHPDDEEKVKKYDSRSLSSVGERIQYICSLIYQKCMKN